MDGVFVHELAHDLVDPKQKLIDDYARLTGWRQVEGHWENSNSLANMLNLWREVEEEGPGHELVWAASLYVTRPDLLIRDRQRYLFLKYFLFDGVEYYPYGQEWI